MNRNNFLFDSDSVTEDKIYQNTLFNFAFYTVLLQSSLGSLQERVQWISLAECSALNKNINDHRREALKPTIPWAKFYYVTCKSLSKIK